MLVVVALGGNALLERSDRPDADVQERHVKAAVEALVPVARSHELVVTHGNGPQVGLLAHETEDDTTLQSPFPLDVLVAQTQGMIGYWLLEALGNALPGRRTAAVVTRTVVDASDPAFGDPQKFIGSLYDQRTAEALAARRGWEVRPDGSGWRRVVASPDPLDIVELQEVRALLAENVIVVCAGGGGVPVVRERGGFRGVPAVVDKDLTAALLAERLGAGALLILTDVEAVETDFRTDHARRIDQITVSELRSLTFPPGSMGPKVEAVCRFVEATGHIAAIGRLDEAELVLSGSAGTLVTSDGVRRAVPTATSLGQPRCAPRGRYRLR